MATDRKRFRITHTPGELLRGERELLNLLVAVHREFREADRISVDTITALTGKENPGTLGYLTLHRFITRTNGADGRPAYSVTAKGLAESRRANRSAFTVPRGLPRRAA